jgi:hypothetical protein
MKTNINLRQELLAWTIIAMFIAALSVFSVNFIRAKTPVPGQHNAGQR